MLYVIFKEICEMIIFMVKTKYKNLSETSLTLYLLVLK